MFRILKRVPYLELFCNFKIYLDLIQVTNWNPNDFEFPRKILKLLEHLRTNEITNLRN